MTVKGVHKKLYKIATGCQRRTGAAGFGASRHAPPRLYRLIRDHPSVDPSLPFFFVRDYFTIAIWWRRRWLGRSAARRCKTKEELFRRMNRAETEWMREMDAEIRLVLGASTGIVNVIDGRLRPRAKLLFARRKPGRRRWLRCRLTVDQALKESRRSGEYKPAYLTNGAAVVVTAVGEADTTIERLLKSAEVRRAGLPAPPETSADVDLLVDILSRLPPSNIATQTGDGDDLVRNASPKRFWTVCLFWPGKVPPLDLVELPGAAAAGPAAAKRNGRAKGALPTSRRDDFDPARPRHVLWYHPELDTVFGTVDEQVRMKMGLAVGQDYSGNGIPGIGWDAALSGLVDGIFHLDWADPDAATKIQGNLDRLASRKRKDELWRAKGHEGRLKRMQPVQLSEELMNQLRRGLSAFQGREDVEMDPVGSVEPIGRGPLDMGGVAAPHVRRPRPKSQSEQDRLDASGEREWRLRPSVDYPVTSFAADAGQPLPTFKSNPRASHPNRLSEAMSPQPTPPGKFPKSPQTVRQVLIGPGPSLVREAIKRAGGKPEIVYGAPAGDNDEDGGGGDDDDDDDDAWISSITEHEDQGGARKAKTKAKKRKLQLGDVYQLRMSPAVAHGVGLRTIVLTNKEVTEAVPTGVKTIPCDTPVAESDGPTLPKTSESAAKPDPALDYDEAPRFEEAREGVEPEEVEMEPKDAAGRRRRKNRNGSAKLRAKRRWLFEEGIASTARVDPSQPSNQHRRTGAKGQTGDTASASSNGVGPSTAAAAPSLSAPHWVVTSATPLLDVVMFSMHSGMPALRAMWQRLASSELDRGEIGHVTLGSYTASRSNLTRTLGGMLAMAREGGARGMNRQETASFARRRTIVEDVVADGFTAPARLPVSVWSGMIAPMQTSLEQIARQRLFISLRYLGDVIGADPMTALPSALEHALRAAHVDFGPNDVARRAYDAIQESPKGAAFTRTLKQWASSLLADSAYSEARADAGASEEPPNKEEEEVEDDEDENDDGESEEVKKQTGPRRSQREHARQNTKASEETAAGKKAERQREPPDLPTFAPGGTFIEDLDKALAKASSEIPANERDRGVRALREYLHSGGNRLLAIRDRVVQMHLIVAKGGAMSEQARAGDDNDDEDGGTADGKALKKLMLSKRVIDGEELSKRLWTLDALARRMAGLPDEDLVPTFSPRCAATSLADLALMLSPDPHDKTEREVLTRVLADVGDIATSHLRALGPLLNGLDSRLLLAELERLCVPVGTTWEAIRGQPPAAFESSRLTIRPELEYELRAFRAWLQHALSMRSGSLHSQIRSERLVAEVANLILDEAALPDGYVGTGYIVISSSSIRQLCADITAVGEEDYKKFRDLPAGDVFAQKCESGFSELSGKSVEARRQTEVFHLRQVNGKPHLVKIVPLASKSIAQSKRLAYDVVFGEAPAGQKPGLHGRKTQKRLNRQGLKRWSRRLHPVAVEKAVRRASPQVKTCKGLNANWGDLRDPAARDAAKLFFRDVDFERDVPIISIDKGEVELVAAHISVPTTMPGYEGRAEQIVYYSRNQLDALRREQQQQAASFRNHLEAELDQDLQEEQAEDPAVIGAFSTAHAMNVDNDWRKLRAAVEEQAEISRAACQILDAVCGGLNERRTNGQLHKTPMCVFVGDGGGETRKGGKGPNSANRVVRELETQAKARNLKIIFLIVPETMTSRRCPVPWCLNGDGRRAKVACAKHDDGSTDFRLVRCERCRVFWHRDATGAVNIMCQGVSLLWHDEPLWLSATEEEDL